MKGNKDVYGAKPAAADSTVSEGDRCRETNEENNSSSSSSVVMNDGNAVVPSSSSRPHEFSQSKHDDKKKEKKKTTVVQIRLPAEEQKHQEPIDHNRRRNDPAGNDGGGDNDGDCDGDDDDFILPALRMMGGNTNNNNAADIDEEDDDEYFQSMAEEYVVRLQHGVPILLDRLVSHLSKLPDVDDDDDEDDDEENQYEHEIGVQQRIGKEDDGGLLFQGHNAAAATPPPPPQGFGVHSSPAGVPAPESLDPLYIPPTPTTPPSSSHANRRTNGNFSSNTAAKSTISKTKSRSAPSAQQQQQQQQMQGGLTLPASAIAWLSNELYPPQRQPATTKHTAPVARSNAVDCGAGVEDNGHADADPSPAVAGAVILEGVATKISNCSLISSPLTRRYYNNNNTTTKSNIDNGNFVDAVDDDFGNSISDFWMDDTTREKLILLTFLLPRVKLLRITRQLWPPELQDKDVNETQAGRNSRSNRRFGRNGRFRRLLSGRKFWKRSRTTSSTRPNQHQGQHQHQPPVDVNCSFLSVNSAVTVDSINHLINCSNLDSQEGVTRRYPTRKEFLMYWHRLQTKPDIDVRVFPRTQVLVLDSVPLAWVHNLIDIQRTLEVLNVHKAAIFRLPPSLFPKPQADSSRTSRQKRPPRIPRVCYYRNLTHLKLDHCSLGELSGLPASLSRLSNLKYLSLQHNEIRCEKTVLSGLRQSSDTLVQLDLRHNSLPSLTNAFLYLGGQLKTIKLSHNNMTTTRGLEKCYALQELWLDNNSFTSMVDLSGLARLPELKLLKIHSNPVTTLGTEYYDPDCRLQLWTWFQEERRCTSPLEMPKLWDGTTIFGPAPTQREWELIADGSFSNVILSQYREPMSVQVMENTLQSPLVAVDVHSSSMPVVLKTPRVNVTMNKGRLRRVSKKGKTRKAQILSTFPERAAGSHKTKSSVVDSEGSCAMTFSTKSSGLPLVSFSLEDVLLSLEENMPEDLKSAEAISIEHLDSMEEEIEFSDALQDMADIAETETLGNFDGVDAPNPFDDIPEEKNDVSKDVHDSLSESNNGQIDNALLEENHRNVDSRAKSPKVDFNVEVSSHIHQSHESTSDLPIALSGDKQEKVDEDRIFPSHAGKGNGSTIKLYLGANSTFSDEILKADWEDLITRASEGLIPDGIPTVPIKDVPLHDVDPVFPDQAVDMLERDGSTGDPANASQMSGTNPAESRATSMGVDTRLPEHIWQDDNSVLSSLGTSRDGALPKSNKFHMAEENSVYDGPETCRDLKVTENLPLYFSSFVFPSSVPDVPKSVLDEMQEDEDDWQAITLYYPRIQLWPEDRRWLERTHVTSSLEIADWSTNRERLVRLWEEYVIPCGKPGLRRLPPNRRIRLGFHGDKLFEGASPNAYAECRKVLLCLSSRAFYIILEEDPVTMSYSNQAKKRRFPLPIDEDLLFRDAPWPHAVARHSLRDLVSVSIGFEFQRLTFRFRNPAIPKSDPFVYVVLTGNKASTVKILQEVQKLAKEATAGVSDIASDTTIAIENDSQLVFDRLNEALSPNPLGTVFHYQILHQRWKHGDRGIVRRAFIVTETKVLLLDEDYIADGHDVANVSVAGDKMADVEYRIVDEAALKQVTEVQAAGDDPKAITLIISPLSSLSRTHRWRLVCRDRDGAERLVDDVRKALAMLSEWAP